MGDDDLVARRRRDLEHRPVAFGDDVGEVDRTTGQCEHACIDVEHRPRAAGRAELQLAAIGDGLDLPGAVDRAGVGDVDLSNHAGHRREREQPAGGVDRDQGFGPE